MKIILALGVGFFIGRQIYSNYNQGETKKKEEEAKKKLSAFLEEKGLTHHEIKTQTKDILGI